MHRHNAPNPGNLPPPPPQPAASLPPVLAEIVAHVASVVERDKQQLPLPTLRQQLVGLAPTRGFVKQLLAAPFGVIAEVKRQSPSAGLIRPEYAGPGFRPEAIAQQYAAHGATAISCLTETKFFGGELRFLGLVRAAVSQPILRKDFILDSYQLVQARIAGADAVLLMAECLPGDTLQTLAGNALALDLDVLIEAHDQANVPRAWEVVQACGQRALLGINNRNLATMHVDLGHTARMVHQFGLDPARVVGESGVRHPTDLQELAKVGVRKVLVGEHLMKQAHPGEALSRLLARAS